MRKRNFIMVLVVILASLLILAVYFIFKKRIETIETIDTHKPQIYAAVLTDTFTSVKSSKLIMTEDKATES